MRSRWISLALALSLAGASVAALSRCARAAGPVVNSFVAVGSGNVPVASVPASIAGSGSWTSGCIAADKYRAFDVFAAIAAAGTLQVQRYANALCASPAGPALPSTALALVTGTLCPPTATRCGDVGSNDGLPFLALTIKLTDTSASTNAITTLTLTQGPE